MTSEPLRTCVGCRGRDEQSSLLRVVMVSPSAPEQGVLMPDPARRAPGRGAYVHADEGCVDAAVKRRAFGRSLHRNGILDAAAVKRWVEQHA